MPTDANTNRLRESAMEFHDLFNKAMETSLFDGLVQELDGSLGFFKPAALALPGAPSAFTGTATVHTVNSASQTYNTIVYEYTWGLDINLIMRLDKVSRGMVSTLLRGIAKKWVGHRDRKLTTLLQTGESTGGLDGNAIFSSTAYTPNPSVTVDNVTATATSGSADEVLSTTHEAFGLFETMTNVGTDLVHGGELNLRLMYSPVGQTDERKFVYDALQPMLLNDEYKFPAGKVRPVSNGYLGSEADLYFFIENYDTKFFAIGIEQEADFVTTAGAPDWTRIINRQEVGQTSYAYEAAFSGDPYGCVLGNDA